MKIKNRIYLFGAFYSLLTTRYSNKLNPLLDTEAKIVSMKNINSAIHTNDSLIKGVKVTIYHPLTKH
ncbi:hypothetical protein KGMB02408_05050 [Bacteroides faecalis]|uniref:Uncharacterized protein n=1 Tax=Bacteroides faecalis TaxID=2447885 RepID=A0A401LPQ2_9BACE|nr:hypothetical protein KGMB02408_05050 [Bacteroides faecalis]